MWPLGFGLNRPDVRTDMPPVPPAPFCTCRNDVCRNRTNGVRRDRCPPADERGLEKCSHSSSSYLYGLADYCCTTYLSYQYTNCNNKQAWCERKTVCGQRGLGSKDRMYGYLVDPSADGDKIWRYSSYIAENLPLECAIRKSGHLTPPTSITHTHPHSSYRQVSSHRTEAASKAFSHHLGLNNHYYCCTTVPPPPVKGVSAKCT